MRPRLCYRPVLRGVSLSNGTVVHEQCVLAARQKKDGLAARITELENSLRTLNDQMSRRRSFTGKLSSLFSGSAPDEQELRQKSEKIQAEIRAVSKEKLCAEVGLTQIYDLFLTYPPDFEERKKRVAARDGERCSNCGAGDGLHLHHIKPLSGGGSNELSNLTLLCGRCHSQAHGGREFETFENEPTAYSKRVADLRRAIATGRQVQFGYRKPQDTGFKQRTLQPVELLNLDHERDGGTTLCVRGFCTLRKENRTFSIKRMRGLKVL
jgi:hypothetical protein